MTDDNLSSRRTDADMRRSR